MRHVLLVVNSYVTEHDPRRGAKFRLHLESYAECGWRVGMVAILQRDYGLLDCARAGGFIIEERVRGAPLIRDCTHYTLTRWIPGSRSGLAGARRAARSVRAYIRRHGRPELLHAHGAQWAGATAHVVHRGEGIPYVITEHMSNLARGDVDARLLPVLGEIYGAARLRLPVSDDLGRTLEDLFGDRFRPWAAVPNMLEEGLFRQPVTRNGAAADFTFLTLAELSAKKGLDVLLNAFARAFSGSQVRLRVAGDGEERAALEQQAAELGIREQVEFPGLLTRDRVAAELGRADAYVLSSHYETFGIPILEAHAAGKPVVATRSGGPEELIDESNGILVPAGDPEALAAAMRDMVERIGDFDSAAIVRACRARFSPPAILSRLERLYEQVLDG